MMGRQLNFNSVVKAIHQIHGELYANANRAVNVSLTLRNWLIGCYIAEYELNGADRAGYGEKLLKALSKELAKLTVSTCNERQLYDCLRFYRTYPQIVQTLSAKFQSLLPVEYSQSISILPTASAKLTISPEKLINQLSYSMFRRLVEIDEDTKRSFYELACIQGNWSVRELNRQIGSLYYERSGLSLNKEKLFEQTQKMLKAQKQVLIFATLMRDLQNSERCMIL